MRHIRETNDTRRELRTLDRARFYCAPHRSNMAPRKTWDARSLVLALILAALSLAPAAILWGAL